MFGVQIDQVTQAMIETPPAIRAVLWKWDTPMTIEDYQFVRAVMTGANIAISAFDSEQNAQYSFFGGFCSAKIDQLFEEKWGAPL